MASLTFKELLNGRFPKGLLVALDPGETTGFATFVDGQLVHSEQLGTGEAVRGAELVWSAIQKEMALRTLPLGWLVLEEYRVYAWKARSHSWSNLHTSRLIGGIDVLIKIWSSQTRTFKQGAQTAKGFCTDDKLKEWGYYTTKRHARDAIRHGCYFSLFGKWSQSERRP